MTWVMLVYHIADFWDAEWATTQWPIQERTWATIEEAILTHIVLPLPAYDEHQKLIVPADYQTKLHSAVVQVLFRLVHYFINKDKKSVFTAILHKIVILHPPASMPVNPLKCGCLADSPSMTRVGPFKKSHLVCRPITELLQYCCSPAHSGLTTCVIICGIQWVV